MKYGCIFLLFSYGLFAYTKESGKFLGGLLAIADDGALEVIQNPAYLAAKLDGRKQKWLFTLESIGGLGYRLSLAPYEKENLKNFMEARYSFALSTGGNGWATGFFLGSAKDIPLQNFAFSIDEENFKLETKQDSLFHEFAWSLSRELDKGQAVGLAITGITGRKDEFSFLRTNMFLAPSWVSSTEERKSQSRVLGSSAIISYFGESKESELGISCRLFTFTEVRNETTAFSEAYFISSNAYQKQEAQKLNEFSTTFPPTCALGLSYRVLNFLQIFGEFHSSLSLKQKDKIINFENGKIITYETEDPAGAGYSFSFGISYPLTNKWSLLSGVQIFWKNYDRVYRADEPNYTSFRRGREEKLQISSGLVYEWSAKVSFLTGLVWGMRKSLEDKMDLKQNQIFQENLSIRVDLFEVHLALQFMLG